MMPAMNVGRQAQLGTMIQRAANLCSADQSLL